jgi:hypothetical protein
MDLNLEYGWIEEMGRSTAGCVSNEIQMKNVNKSLCRVTFV